MEGLTKREQQILNYMKQEIKTKGYPPTVREICAAVGIKSTSTAHKDIESLVRQGYLVKDPSKPRALLVKDPFGMETVQSASNLVEIPRNDVIDVPIVGRVAAGTPILAEQNIEDSFPIPSRYASTGTNYMLRVRGESMIEAGIMDGDIVIVEKTATAENGDIVVALIDDEATVKTFYKEDGHFRLQPENKTMLPIIVTSLMILGRVVTSIRFY